MTSHKVPYWLSPTDIKALNEMLSQESINGHLADEIRNELHVARIRAQNSHISPNALVIVLDLSKDSIPVHLSEDEVEFLHTLEQLPQEVKNRLS